MRPNRVSIRPSSCDDEISLKMGSLSSEFEGVNWLQNRRTWNTSAAVLNKSLRRLNLCIESMQRYIVVVQWEWFFGKSLRVPDVLLLLLVEPGGGYYYKHPQTPPVIFPAIVSQPLPLGVQCHWCGEYICRVGQLYRFLFFFHYQESSWAPPGPPAGQIQNQPGFCDAETLYPNLIHESIETISMDGYTRPYLDRGHRRDRR